MSKKIHYLWVTLLVSLTCAGLALAQVTTGTISGTVRDETGAVLPGVTINAVNTDTGVARTVISDDEGRYHAVNLAVGPYEIRAELTGFQSSLRSGVQLTIGREAVVDFALRVGEISETIEVTGEAPLVETTGAAISGLIEEKRILELPLNGRSFEQLATLELGVNWARGAGTGEEQGRANQISIAGARPSYSSWMMDGTAIANSAGATPGGRGGQFLGVETVKEFRVETSTYGAEFGGSAG